MEIAKGIHYIGVNDHQLDLFEGQYAVPKGMSYNSYLILDQRVAVLDAVDRAFTGEWLEKLAAALDGRQPDYLIVQHMEPDHSAGIAAFLAAYPDAVVAASQRALTMIDQFFGPGLCHRTQALKEGDTLSLGRHSLRFIAAPMVHWPEVLVSYDSAERVLFSADAFGKFGALDAEEPWTDEARRYYIGIVGKYGVQVQALLKKAAALDIAAICPLHGPVLRQELGACLELYNTWSAYAAETRGVCVAYTSVYGHTKQAALLLAETLEKAGCPTAVYDLARCDMAAAVADAFRFDKLALATTTYNGEMFPFMKQFIDHLTERNYQNRTVALLENGSWAPQAARLMAGMLEKSKNLTFAQPVVTLRSALTEENRQSIAALAAALAEFD